MFSVHGLEFRAPITYTHPVRWFADGNGKLAGISFKCERDDSDRRVVYCTMNMYLSGRNAPAPVVPMHFSGRIFNHRHKTKVYRRTLDGWITFGNQSIKLYNLDLIRN